MVQPAGSQEEALQEARETHVHGGGTQGQGGTTGNHGNMVCEYVSVIWGKWESLRRHSLHGENSSLGFIESVHQ